MTHTSLHYLFSEGFKPFILIEFRCYEKNEKNLQTLLREFPLFYESKIPDFNKLDS